MYGPGMLVKAHIAIIGGGIIGLSCARSLVARGVKVTVYEKMPLVGGGAAEYNSGMIHPSQSSPWIRDLKEEVFQSVYELACRSRALLETHLSTMWPDQNDFTPGTLQLFDSPYKGEEALERYESRKVPVQRYQGDWSFGRYCLKFPDDLSGNARRYMQVLVKELRSLDCQFVTNYEVHDLEGIAHSVDAIVIACGSEAKRFVDLPIQSVPGHALIYNIPDISLPPIPVMHSDSHSAMSVFPAHFRLSGTVNLNEPDALLKIWGEIAPEIMRDSGPPIHRWTGNRPVSLLGRPFIGPTKTKNVYVCGGHGHMGWTLCAGSGELMADIILEGRSAPEYALP